jgi:hypothetical protein
MTKTIEERFHSKYTKNPVTGCWDWIAAKMPNGRGEIGYKDKDGKWKYKYAYRVSYEIYKGTIPPDMLVCHTCDNPSCVSPAHLWLGSVQDNSNDMVIKGRSTHGEKNPMSKLTWDTVYKIRADKRTQQQIADELGVSRGLVGQIKRNEIWNE